MSRPAPSTTTGDVLLLVGVILAILVVALWAQP